MTYRQLILEYQSGINKINRELLNKIPGSLTFQNLNSAELKAIEKTLQFHIYKVSTEFRAELEQKIKEIEAAHGHQLDAEIEIENPRNSPRNPNQKK